MNTLDLASKKVRMRKVSNTNCGEWQGPCPGCGGEDRFHVWPEQNGDKGGYWCRQCGKHGDNIQFLRDFEGMSFVDACNYLNIPLPERGNASVASRGSAPGGVSSFGNGGPGSGRNPSLPPSRPEFIPNEHAAPADLWQEKALKFVAWSQDNLSKDNATLAWLAARGISSETAVNFRLGWNIGEDGKDFYRARKAWGLPEVLKDDGRPKALWIPRGLVIPYIVDGVMYRIRIRRPDESGPTGWNGRSLIIETISHVMGALAGSIPSEMLLSQKYAKSSSAPSPDIMSLKGVRMAFASEIDEGQKFSAAKIKWLTGKDELVGRNPHDKYPTRFYPTHKLFLMTNTQPEAPANDKSFWERLHLIPFTISFVNRDPQETYERRAIVDLDRQLKAEASGILAWLVRGCLRYQQEGLNPPMEVTAASEEYRRGEDVLADFIDECCIREEGAKEKANILYKRYVAWYHDNIGVKEQTGTWFGKLLKQKFNKTKVNGCVTYHGICLNDAVFCKCCRAQIKDQADPCPACGSMERLSYQDQQGELEA